MREIFFLFVSLFIQLHKYSDVIQAPNISAIKNL